MDKIAEIMQAINETILLERISFCEGLLDQIQDIVQSGQYDSRSFIAVITLIQAELERLKR